MLFKIFIIFTIIAVVSSEYIEVFENDNFEIYCSNRTTMHIIPSNQLDTIQMNSAGTMRDRYRGEIDRQWEESYEAMIILRGDQDYNVYTPLEYVEAFQKMIDIDFDEDTFNDVFYPMHFGRPLDEVAGQDRTMCIWHGYPLGIDRSPYKNVTNKAELFKEVEPEEFTPTTTTTTPTPTTTQNSSRTPSASTNNPSPTPAVTTPTSTTEPTTNNPTTSTTTRLSYTPPKIDEFVDVEKTFLNSYGYMDGPRRKTTRDERLAAMKKCKAETNKDDRCAPYPDHPDLHYNKIVQDLMAMTQAINDDYYKEDKRILEEMARVQRNNPK